MFSRFLSSTSRRGVQRIFRKKLPKYKLDFRTLPPLTQLLTDPAANNIGIEDSLQLRRDKLAIYAKYLPIDDPKNLLEAIFHEDNDLDRLLKIIDENLETMTSFYVGVSFEAIDDMLRVGLCDRSTIAVAPEFRRLCSKALYKMRFFESDEVLKVAKCLATLKVPEETLLVQATLQMARHFIDDFSVEELECLDHTLESFSTSQEARKSLLLALKEAIPLARAKKIEHRLVMRDTVGYIPDSKRSS